MQETWEMWVWFLGRENPLKKEIATHPSILAWRTPWTEEPHGVHRVAKSQTQLKWLSTHTYNLYSERWSLNLLSLECFWFQNFVSESNESLKQVVFKPLQSTENWYFTEFIEAFLSTVLSCFVPMSLINLCLINVYMADFSLRLTFIIHCWHNLLHFIRHLHMLQYPMRSLHPFLELGLMVPFCRCENWGLSVTLPRSVRYQRGRTSTPTQVSVSKHRDLPDRYAERCDLTSPGLIFRI